MATYIVPTDKNPSVLNKNTLIGALVGSFVGQTAFGAMIGTVAGGYVGYRGQAIEKQYGRVVHEPNIINEDTGIGALTGALIAGVTMAALSISLPVSVLVGGGLMALGGYIGGKYGKARMQTEYDEAEKLALEGKAKVVGIIDLSKHPEQAQVYGLKPQQQPAITTSQPLALPEPQTEIRTNHAARIREQQTLAATTGRNV